MNNLHEVKYGSVTAPHAASPKITHSTPLAEDLIQISVPATPPLILIVDDEKHICNIVEEYFTILGYRVIKALNGESGMKRFMDNRPAIVITDLDITDCTGLDIASRIKQLSPETTIILISGHPIESLAIGDTAGKIDYTMQKPIDFTMLAGIVESIAVQRQG